jgi:chemosensory pili system protein ChpA (sensor histidine kinase/response regulator)
MNDKTDLNVESIVWVKNEIDQALELVRQQLEKYLRNPDDSDQLKSCREQIHQVHGVIEMLGLNGVAAVSWQMEKIINTLINSEGKSDFDLDSFSRATLALSHYFGEIIDGLDNNPLRLFPAYQDLVHAHGLHDVSEGILFFPDLSIQAPPQNEFTSQDSIIPIEVVAKNERSKFQVSLLKWLRDATDKESLQQMFDVVEHLGKTPASIEQRTFWWVSKGFIDSLLNEGLAVDLPARRLCARLEQEIRHLDSNTVVVNEQLMREVLFKISRSKIVSEHSREIFDAYGWYEQRPVIGQPVEKEKLEVILEEMRITIAEARDAWVQYNNGKKNNLSLLLVRIKKLKELVVQIKHQDLEKLITVIGGISAHLKVQPQAMNEILALEFAISLLLIEDALDNFSSLSSEFTHQVEVVSTRLRSAVQGKKTSTLMWLDGASSKVQNKELMEQISHECSVGLKQAEEVLDSFFRDSNKSYELPMLFPLFKQISGVLVMLEFGRANALLVACRNLTEEFSHSNYEYEYSEHVRLAEGLSSIGFFIEGLKYDQRDRANIIETAISQFGSDIVAAIVPPSIDESIPIVSNELAESAASPVLSETSSDELAESAASPASSETSSDKLAESPSSASSHDSTEQMIGIISKEIDQGTQGAFLKIFLEESELVLSNIADCIQACRDNPDDRDSLTAMRRGFHTLKGGGHTVGLLKIAEVAWSMEQILSRWLSEVKPVNDELLDLIEKVHQEFCGWCTSLKENGATQINKEEIVSTKRPESSTELETQTETEVEAEKTDAAQNAQSAATTHVTETETKPSIVIGDAIISPELFEIFTTEVNQHLATLEHELNNLIGNPNRPVSHEFMLAAHTLASISRNLKLEFIADIGHVLEQWLTILFEKSAQPDQTGLQLMRNVIELLNRMLSAVCSQRLPDQVDLQAGVTLSHEMALMPERTKQIAETEDTNIQWDRKPNEVLSRRQELDSQKDHVDLDLLETFIEEAGELMPVIGSELRSWRSRPKDENIRKALLRGLHTLKGSARIAGAMSLGELVHNMESGVEAAPKENELSMPYFDSLETELDLISESIESLQDPHKDREKIVEIEEMEESTVPLSSILPDSQSVKTEETVPLGKSEETGTPLQKTLLRVNADLIDHLVNESGEVSIARSRIETELHNFKQSLLDLTESTVRLRNQLREVEIQAETQMQSHLALTKEDEETFDPLEFDQFTRFQELTRLMAESVDDVFTVQQSMLITHNAAEEALNQQARMNRDLQQALTHIRTVPFSNFAEHFYRVVRQVARDMHKKAILKIQDGHIEMDRSVLEKINSPLEHLLRNSVAHGIEEPTKRLELGKPEIGQITIVLRQEGNEIVMTLSDDGAGLDIDRIREKALQQGLMQADEKLNDKQVIEFIFAHGLSTMQELSEVAGRGIGLDVVKNEITSLGGRVEIASEINAGATFTIYLPLTLAVAQTLMVKAGVHTYAIPATLVEHVSELDADALNTAYRDHRVNFSGNSFLFAYLPRLLGDQQPASEIKKHNRVLLLRSGALRLAVHVDELIGNSEVVVKNIGAQLARVPGVEGAAVMGDGHIILIINPLKLMHREEVQAVFTSDMSALPSAQTKPDKAAMVMVVDDSLTVRKITSRLLEREGCEVLIAKDGVVATQLLQDIIPDVMLVDLEMPRMDGFELIRSVRSNPRTKNIPIIIISSRTAEKHRNVAKNLGVNMFLGKPYKEDELLKNITKFIK